MLVLRLAALITSVALLLPGCSSGKARPILKALRGPPATAVSVKFPAGRESIIGGVSAPLVGEQLYTTNGSWSNSPTSFTYQWRDCNTGTETCSNATGSPSTAQYYVIVAGDASGCPAATNCELEAVVTANTGGSAKGKHTGVIPGAGGLFGNQTVGATANGGMGADFKRVTSVTDGVTGQLTKVTMYLSATGTAGTQTLRNVIYADSSGAPGALLGVSDEISFSQSTAAGWYELTLPDSLSVTGGTNYWLGMITGPTNNVIQFNYDITSGNIWALIADSYADGPTDPFGTPSYNLWKMSVYGTVQPATAPANISRPTLSGTVTVGSTLTSTNGTWTNSPTSFTYQWQDCDSAGINCQYIAGATSSTYVIAAGDVGHAIRSVVSAINTSGSTSRTSAVTTVVPGAAPGNITLPVVSGTPIQGQTLTTTNGTWSGSPSSFAYQWRDCDSGGANCTNATGTGNTTSSYVLTSNDVTHTMRVIVTATNASGSTPATSAQTGVVTGTALPVNTVLPVISGTPTVGNVLTTTDGTWTSGGSAATCGGVITCTYQWQHCAGASCTNASGSGSTTNTYTIPTGTPPAGDSGDTLRVIVTATNGSGSTPATSAETATVTGGGGTIPVNTALPAAPTDTTNANLFLVGDTLTASTGTWANSPTSFSYQWMREDTVITGATSSTYTLASGDLDHTLDVVVTATNGAGTSGPAPSASAGVTVNPCTVTTSSWATAAGDINSGHSGQTICLNSGTYTTSGTPISGNNAAMTTLEATPGTTPATLSDQVPIGTPTHSNNIRLEGFTLGNGLANFGNGNLNIVGMSYSNGVDALWGQDGGDTAGATIQELHNHVVNLLWVSNSNSNQGWGFYGCGQRTNMVQNYNTFQHMNEHPLQLGSCATVTAIGNEYLDVVTTDPARHVDCIEIWAGTGASTVQDNRCTDIASSPGVSTDMLLSGDSGPFTMVNNLIVNSDEKCLDDDPNGTSSVSMSNGLIENNTLWNCAYAPGIGMSGAGTGNTVKFNITGGLGANGSCTQFVSGGENFNNWFSWNPGSFTGSGPNCPGTNDTLINPSFTSTSPSDPNATYATTNVNPAWGYAVGCSTIMSCKGRVGYDAHIPVP